VISSPPVRCQNCNRSRDRYAKAAECLCPLSSTVEHCAVVEWRVENVGTTPDQYGTSADRILQLKFQLLREAVGICTAASNDGELGVIRAESKRAEFASVYLNVGDHGSERSLGRRPQRQLPMRTQSQNGWNASAGVPHTFPPVDATDEFWMHVEIVWQFSVSVPNTGSRWSTYSQEFGLAVRTPDELTNERRKLGVRSGSRHLHSFRNHGVVPHLEVNLTRTHVLDVLLGEDICENNCCDNR